MPLTRLAEFYDRIPDAVPEHHQKRPVKWLIHLDGAGRFLQFISTVGEGGRATEYVVPYRRRSGTKPPPYLLADTPAYVLGLGLDKMTNEAAAERRRDFAALVEECAETCGAAALRAVASFVAADPPAPPADLAAGDTLTFVVDGELVTALPEVRAFWQERQSAEPEDGAGLVAECLLCGQTRPIAKRHPVELRLARDRVQIITANANAFESFGLEASEIAPICLPCALRYGQAARYLMTSKEHHYQAGGLHYVYWTRSGGHGGLFSILQDPQPEQVEALLQAAFHSRAAPGVDHDAFYAFSATSNTGRLVIRDWLETTVGEVKEHLGRWFAGQELVGGRGEASEPIGLYALAGSLVRKDARNKPKLDDLPPQALPALVGAALFGRRLPVWLLHQAIRRCHAEQQLTRPRAALVKMVLNSVPESERRVPLMTASLAANSPTPHGPALIRGPCRRPRRA